MNAGAPRTPTNAAQRAIANAASAFSSGVRRALDSGAKIVRRNKNQAANVAAQQDDASAAVQHDTTSMTVNTPSVNTPDGGNSKHNAAQEHGAMASDASFLSDFGARASQASQVSRASAASQDSQVGMNAANEFSHVGNQVASPAGNSVASETNLGAPPRPDTSGDNVTATGVDLLDTANTTTGNDSVTGTHIPAPSPR